MATGQWHTAWQAKVPASRREVRIGNRRADAVTPEGVVVEFQDSYISIETVTAREKHYDQGVWVVNMAGKEAPPWWCMTSNWTIFLDYGPRKRLRVYGADKIVTRSEFNAFLNGRGR